MGLQRTQLSTVTAIVSAFGQRHPRQKINGNKLCLGSTPGDSFSKVPNHPCGARSRHKDLDSVVRAPKLVQERGLENQLEILTMNNRRAPVTARPRSDAV